MTENDVLLYRGYHSENPSDHVNKPFTTIRSLPTFTDCPDIAAAYAETANDSFQKSEKSYGAVGIYRVRMKNPLKCTECVFSLNELQETLGERIKTKQWAILLEKTFNEELWVNPENEEFELNFDEFNQMTNEEKANLYIYNFHLIDDPLFIVLLKQSGYDGVMAPGYFDGPIHRDRSLIASVSSYDPSEDTAMEYRPFYEHQVSFAFTGDPIQSVKKHQDRALDH